MARKKSKANYFTKETEEYIVKYNNSTDPEYRNKIFQEHIYLPFYKLAENIIHTFKFYYTDVDKLEDLKHEIISVLVEEKIMKFDPSKGAKAYSYFGTIVKRWLINYNNKNYKKLLKMGSFDSIQESFDDSEVDLDKPSAKSLSKFVDEWVKDSYETLDGDFKHQKDKQIADAVLTLFKSRADLDIFKKKALYIYIREMTGCNTPNLTKVISTLKDDFYEKYQKQIDNGKMSSK